MVISILLIGTLQASSINLSHEINHKMKKWERGTLNLSKNLYMHFLIEHNEGHHKKVSTPEDTASSRFNESLYKLLPRSIIGGSSLLGISKIKGALKCIKMLLLFTTE